MSNPLCPLCRSHDNVNRDHSATKGYKFSCLRCGQFETDYGFSKHLSDLPENIENIGDRAILSGITRSATDLKGSFNEVLAPNNYKRIISSSGSPISVYEQIDALLLAIAERAKFFGEFTKEEPIQPWIARAYLPTEPNFHHLLEALLKESLPLINIQRPSNERHRFSLTLAGWERIRTVKSHKGEGNQAFVAMWFHDMVYKIFDSAIAPALEEVGYKPYLVSRASNNNRIDDEIIAQIRKSRILIAEVTGERTGVYYEAGFAQGLGIPVIWCCNDSWRTRLPQSIEPETADDPSINTFTWPDRMHFDTRQFPHILWKDENHFKKQLIERIQALDLDLSSSIIP